MRIALLGDMALFGIYSKKNNKDLIRSNLNEVISYLSQFDYVVGNLETPFSYKKIKHGAKSAYICSEPENVEILKLLHVNAVSLANNHMFDFGNEGYETTKSLLKKTEIEWFGTEGKELNVEIDGNKLTFSGYCCYSSNPRKCVPFGQYGVNAYNFAVVKDRMIENDKRGYFNIIAVHAGIEHVNLPSIDHIKVARKFAETMPYVYYGHHPHVIQGVEEYNGSLIAHSLGNFCFDDVYTDVSKNTPLIELTENNRTGLILELTIENNKVINWKEQIIHIGKRDEGITLVEAPENIRNYNLELKNSEYNIDEFNLKRNSIINLRMSERKAMRNLSWYLKRFRLRYFLLLITNRRNANKYRKNIKKWL